MIIAAWSPSIADTQVALTVIALQTNKIRLGPLVTPLPRRRPWKVARETVSMDVASKGRLILGVGIGGGPEGTRPEWENFGEEQGLKRRGEMLDESLEIISQLWQGQPMSYEGQYYQLKEAHFLPTPLQSPRVPIWVGGWWPNKAPFRRAARWDGVFPMLGGKGEETITQLRNVINYVHHHRTSEDDYDIVHLGVTPGQDRGQATEIVTEYAEVGVTWWVENIAALITDSDQWPLQQMRERILQGPVVV